MPKSNTLVLWMRKFEYFVIKCASKNGHKLKRDWSVCSKYAKHSRFTTLNKVVSVTYYLELNDAIPLYY